MVKITNEIHRKIWLQFSSDIRYKCNSYMIVLNTNIFSQLYLQFFLQLNNIIND